MQDQLVIFFIPPGNFMAVQNFNVESGGFNRSGQIQNPQVEELPRIE